MKGFMCKEFSFPENPEPVRICIRDARTHQLVERGYWVGVKVCLKEKDAKKWVSENKNSRKYEEIEIEE